MVNPVLVSSASLLAARLWQVSRNSMSMAMTASCINVFGDTTAARPILVLSISSLDARCFSNGRRSSRRILSRARHMTYARSVCFWLSVGGEHPILRKSGHKA